uniref:Uncharacterized protein n=1 Tax=Anguilla anguilla TaxID=7936 RepID=A0A0E9QJ21_ANGAN
MLEFIISGSFWRCHQCAVRMTQGLWFMVLREGPALVTRLCWFTVLDAVIAHYHFSLPLL